MRLGPLAAFNASISPFVVHYRADIEYSPLDHCVGILRQVLMYHSDTGLITLCIIGYKDVYRRCPISAPL
jgi:hypothetical protein